MDWTSLYGGSVASKQLTQYPDARLYNAAKALRPGDRPTVPVRLSDNPAEQFQGYQGVSDKDLPEAFTLPENDSIWINARKARILGNNTRLAGNIGHEQRHITGGNEIEARTKEVEILKQLGERRYADLIRSRYGIK